ncbi:MAG: formylglycine-generating enzyme family protein [Planctomycetaceae bacterium]
MPSSELESNWSETNPVDEVPTIEASLPPLELSIQVPPDPEWADGWGEDEYGPFVEVWIDRVVQRLRWIPPGRFMMGASEDEVGRWEDGREGPQHEEVITTGFWMFETPCTQELWDCVMEENPSRFKSPRRPVERVTWDDANAFIERFNSKVLGPTLTLPTEAQWEYACRAGTVESTYVGNLEILGDNNGPILDSVAWYGGNCGVNFDLERGYDVSQWPAKQYEFATGGTRIVGLKQPNTFGLFDMLGNVWEWCSDNWRQRHDASPEPSLRVLRGGSWSSDAGSVRCACRIHYAPNYRDSFIGFRCAVVDSIPLSNT